MKLSIISANNVEHIIQQRTAELHERYDKMREDYGCDPFDPANASLFD